jgi:hypothetical protein
VALGSESGTANLFCSSWNFGDHRMYHDTGADGRRSVTVSVVRLDHLAAACRLPSADLIKMDVQGYECQVLAGMKETLKSAGRLRMLTEFWPYGMKQAGGDSEWFFATLEHLGFTAHRPTTQGVGPRLTYADALAMLPPFRADSPDGCYINLLFVKG